MKHYKNTYHNENQTVIYNDLFHNCFLQLGFAGAAVRSSCSVIKQPANIL